MFEDLREFFKDNGFMLVKALIWACCALLLTGVFPAFITTGDRSLDVLIMLYFIVFIGVLCSFIKNMFKYTQQKPPKGKLKK